MNTSGHDHHSPFTLAQASARQHPVALDIDAHAARLLPDTHAAVWFNQLLAVALRCTFVPPPGLPPCAADAYTNDYVSLAVAHDIISRKDADGNPLFPNLAAHLEVA